MNNAITTQRNPHHQQLSENSRKHHQNEEILLQTPHWQTALPRPRNLNRHRFCSRFPCTLLQQPWHASLEHAQISCGIHCRHHQLRASLQTHATQQQQNTTTSHNVQCHIQLHRLWSLLVWIHFLSQQLSMVMEIMHILVCTMLTPHGRNHCLLSRTQHHTLGHTTSQTHSTTHIPTHTHAHGLTNNDENHARTTHHQLSKTLPPQILQNNGTPNRKHNKNWTPTQRPPRHRSGEQTK